MSITPLGQVFIDRCVDEINSFHRDDRKAQAKQIRIDARAMEKAILDSVAVLSPADAKTFVEDKAREVARAYLDEEYGEDTMKRRDSLAKG